MARAASSPGRRARAKRRPSPTLELPGDWRAALAPELSPGVLARLGRYLARERQRGPVYPPEEQIFAALQLTPLDQVRVVILGQDPYHGPGQAHGLAFSVPEDAPLPPSLANIFKELQADLGCAPPRHGCLERWAKQGVLLLNAVLTVGEGQAHSHRGRGWEEVTDAILRALARRPEPLVFVLWGNAARAKAKLLEGTRHAVIASPHPSPLSAHSGFFGSRPFSRVNQALARLGQPPIQWAGP